VRQFESGRSHQRRNKLWFIGDVHGEFEHYNKVINKLSESIQLGDMGLGFHPLLDADFPDCFPEHRFIRGNHDNPKTCRNKKEYLGDYGYLPNFKLFFVGGAHSIDSMHRTNGFDWWNDEQLSRKELFNALKSYRKHKPRIMISHDCPSLVLHRFGINDKRDRTTFALDEMLKAHKPEFWIFAHHHRRLSFEERGVSFEALGIMDIYHVK
jgi:hypothetical protein